MKRWDRELAREVGRRLYELREKAGEPAPEVSRLLGIPLATLLAYERGERRIPFDDLAALADHYGVSADYILSNAATPESKLPPQTLYMIKELAGRQPIRNLFRRTKDLTDEQVEALNRIIDALYRKEKRRTRKDENGR